MQKKTLDDYSIQELLELSIERLLEIRRHTVEFIIQTLDTSGLTGLNINNKNQS